MPRYLTLGTYNEAGKQALASQPQDRVEGLRRLIDGIGGRLISLDFTTGEYDVVGVSEFPDDVAATAMSLAVQKAGHIRSLSTTRLISPDEMMQAMEVASGKEYAPPRRG